MKKLLLVVLSFLVMATATVGHSETQNELRTKTLIQNVRTHPDAVYMGDDWYHIEIKENISGGTFDWRFDIRSIDVQGQNMSIGHREEQNSGTVPNASWVIKYNFTDMFGDGTLNYWNKDRFISVQPDGGEDTWYRIYPQWPDKHSYGIFTEEEAIKLYEEELEYWENKL